MFTFLCVVKYLSTLVYIGQDVFRHLKYCLCKSDFDICCWRMNSRQIFRCHVKFIIQGEMCMLIYIFIYLLCVVLA